MRQSHGTANCDEGFTLIELVVALGMLVLVFVAAAGAIIGGYHTQQDAEGIDHATSLAADRLSQVSELGWSNIGFYQDQYGAGVAAAGGTNGYGTDGTSDPTVILGPTAPSAAPTGVVLNPYYSDTSHGGTMYVTTYITYASSSSPTLPQRAGSGDPYTWKRVTVRVAWFVNGVRHTTTSQELIAPTINDEVPPGITTTVTG